MRCVIASLVAAIIGCNAPTPEHPADTPAATRADTGSIPAATASPSGPPPDWRRFQGDGFTLRIPPGTTERPGTSHPNDQPGIWLEGPPVAGSSRPSWRLTVVTYPNAAGRSLAAWVDSVREVSNTASADDPDSLAWLASADTLTLGGRVRALRLQPFCGDCEAYEVYVAVPGRIVMFGIVYDIGIPGDRDEQRRLYDTILSTFRADSGRTSRPSA